VLYGIVETMRDLPYPDSNMFISLCCAGYLDYMKKLGYTMAHIWACPPSEGDDYIFHCHPNEQKIPKPKRLQVWLTHYVLLGALQCFLDSLIFHATYCSVSNPDLLNPCPGILLNPYPDSGYC
jgi:hypothetical protein